MVRAKTTLRCAISESKSAQIPQPEAVWGQWTSELVQNYLTKKALDRGMARVRLYCEIFASSLTFLRRIRYCISDQQVLDTFKNLPAY